MVATNQSIGNRLLLALPRRELDHLKPQLDGLSLDYKDVLVDVDATLDRVYFPHSGVISFVGVFSDGGTAEMATIGREGSTGFQEILGARVASARQLVQVPGSAAVLKRSIYTQALKELPAFRALMFAQLHAFLDQVMLSAGCNGMHSVKQRLARWLLMMRDRSDSDAMPLTQDLLAEMLGVYRPTVTKAVRSLQRAGAIDVGRRRVEIVNRERLLASSCECYSLNRARTAHLLPKTYPA